MPPPHGDGGDARDPRYRPNVGVILFNQAGDIWVGERIDTPGAWQLPQGGIDDGEAPWPAALRELKEEIGTDNVECLAEFPGWLTYDLPPDIAAKRWRGRFLGQQQKWFACRFLGAESEIDIATDHPEFSAWRWIPLSDLPTAAVAFKREVYVALVNEFSGLTGS